MQHTVVCLFSCLTSVLLVSWGIFCLNWPAADLNTSFIFGITWVCSGTVQVRDREERWDGYFNNQNRRTELGIRDKTQRERRAKAPYCFRLLRSLLLATCLLLLVACYLFVGRFGFIFIFCWLDGLLAWDRLERRRGSSACFAVVISPLFFAERIRLF
jgi:hypothetical protein